MMQCSSTKFNVDHYSRHLSSLSVVVVFLVRVCSSRLDLQFTVLVNRTRGVGLFYWDIIYSIPRTFSMCLKAIIYFIPHRIKHNSEYSHIIWPETPKICYQKYVKVQLYPYKEPQISLVLQFCHYQINCSPHKAFLCSLTALLCSNGPLVHQ